jgi:hypothetical protein
MSRFVLSMDTAKDGLIVAVIMRENSGVIEVAETKCNPSQDWINRMIRKYKIRAHTGDR